MKLLLILLWTRSRSDQTNRCRPILNVSELKRRKNSDVLLNVSVFVQFILRLHLRPVCRYHMFSLIAVSLESCRVFPVWEPVRPVCVPPGSHGLRTVRRLLCRNAVGLTFTPVELKAAQTLQVSSAARRLGTEHAFLSVASQLSFCVCVVVA